MYQIANEAHDFQYKRAVCPSGYDSETWRSTKLLTKKLQTFINKCLRKILNIHWPEVISNEELWERTQQIRIDESIIRRKWKWSGMRYGSLRIISPVALSSETLRGLEEEVAQSNPGGEV